MASWSPSEALLEALKRPKQCKYRWFLRVPLFCPRSIFERFWVNVGFNLGALFALVGDLFEVLPKLTAAINEHKAG